MNMVLDHRKKHQIQTNAAARTEAKFSYISNEILEIYPFFQEPVTFYFGDDYGNQLFLDLQQEFLYQNDNKGFPHHIGCGIVFEDMKKYSMNDDIYILSQEAAMIEMFLRDNLF